MFVGFITQHLPQKLLQNFLYKCFSSFITLLITESIPFSGTEKTKAKFPIECRDDQQICDEIRLYSQINLNTKRKYFI